MIKTVLGDITKIDYVLFDRDTEAAYKKEVDKLY